MVNLSDDSIGGKTTLDQQSSSIRRPHAHHPRRYLLTPRRFLWSADPKQTHPTVLAHARHRAKDVQLRLADTITAFAGSMWFVYIHIIVFSIWMFLGERAPWPMLTLVVSLEAIFLSTFVMIGQNRAASFQQEKADRDYQEQESLLVENTELTRVIYKLSDDIHKQIATEVASQLNNKNNVAPNESATSFASNGIARTTARSADSELTRQNAPTNGEQR